MCAITALFSLAPRPLGALAHLMNRAARHRGPDDEGYALFSGGDLAVTPLAGPDTPSKAFGAQLAFAPELGRSVDVPYAAHVALAHRRLSIVDLSVAGHQPMCDATRRYWIVYNGEVYNHIELRDELRAYGRNCESGSDTEVILQAYAQWGADCVARFNGMFAFVLVDRVDKQVMICRDRFGVKPLYYWRSPEGVLAIASEIKQFAVLPGWRALLDAQRAYDFLNWGMFDHEAATMFAGVRQLRGGEMIHCPIADLATEPPVRRWYALKPTPSDIDLPGAAQRVRELLDDAVRLRLRADVQVGSCLSGGLDSSSIVCLANAQLRELGAQAQQRTFSARADDLRVDEGRHIAAVVSHTGAENLQVTPRASDLFDLLERVVWHQDEPFGSTSIFAQWHVFGLAARNGVRVMLDGQGADEQLAGYASFYPARFSTLLRERRWRTLGREMMAVRAAGRLSDKHLLGYAFGSLLPAALRTRLRSTLGHAAHEMPDWLALTELGAQARDPYAGLPGEGLGMQNVSRAQLTRTNLPMLLHWEDRNSMAHSIEARVPFLDYRLVEFVLGLPDYFKLAGADSKIVLREAMRGVLPESIRTRTDKIGFATSEEKWMRGEASASFREALRQAIDASRGVVRPTAAKVMDDILSGARHFSHLPWRIICFGAWMERFGVEVGT